MAIRWLDPAASDTRDGLADLTAGQADVYLDPAYLQAMAAGGEATVLVVEAGDGRLLVPLILRPVPAQLESDRLDGESPYGYAAARWSGDGEALWRQAATALAARGVVNVFLRNHPLEPWPEMLSEPLRPLTRAPTAAIPLDEGRAAAFAGGTVANHRSQVNRARKLGFSADCTVAPSAAALAVFRQLYEGTMARLGASSFYHFDDAHWQHLEQLGSRLALVTVRDGEGRAHNQALFLAGPRFLHYHLSARIDDAHNAAGNLLFEAAADWAEALGLAGKPGAAIHLGGGTSGAEEDPLLAYKRRIGRRSAEFRTAGLIADPEAHAALVAAWAARSGREPRWFQAYRQPG
jgi:hypothetical protein